MPKAARCSSHFFTGCSHRTSRRCCPGHIDIFVPTARARLLLTPASFGGPPTLLLKNAHKKPFWHDFGVSSKPGGWLLKVYEAVQGDLFIIFFSDAANAKEATRLSASWTLHTVEDNLSLIRTVCHLDQSVDQLCFSLSFHSHCREYNPHNGPCRCQVKKHQRKRQLQAAAQLPGHLQKHKKRKGAVGTGARAAAGGALQSESGSDLASAYGYPGWTLPGTSLGAPWQQHLQYSQYTQHLHLQRLHHLQQMQLGLQGMQGMQGLQGVRGLQTLQGLQQSPTPSTLLEGGGGSQEDGKDGGSSPNTMQDVNTRISMLMAQIQALHAATAQVSLQLHQAAVARPTTAQTTDGDAKATSFPRLMYSPPANSIIPYGGLSIAQPKPKTATADGSAIDKKTLASLSSLSSQSLHPLSNLLNLSTLSSATGATDANVALAKAAASALGYAGTPGGLATSSLTGLAALRPGGLSALSGLSGSLAGLSGIGLAGDASGRLTGQSSTAESTGWSKDESNGEEKSSDASSSPSRSSYQVLDSAFALVNMGKGKGSPSSPVRIPALRPSPLGSSGQPGTLDGAAKAATAKTSELEGTKTSDGVVKVEKLNVNPPTSSQHGSAQGRLQGSAQAALPTAQHAANTNNTYQNAALTAMLLNASRNKMFTPFNRPLQPSPVTVGSPPRAFSPVSPPTSPAENGQVSSPVRPLAKRGHGSSDAQLMRLAQQAHQSGAGALLPGMMSMANLPYLPPRVHTAPGASHPLRPISASGSPGRFMATSTGAGVGGGGMFGHIGPNMTLQGLPQGVGTLHSHSVSSVGQDSMQPSQSNSPPTIEPTQPDSRPNSLPNSLPNSPPASSPNSPTHSPVNSPRDFYCDTTQAEHSIIENHQHQQVPISYLTSESKHSQEVNIDAPLSTGLDNGTKTDPPVHAHAPVAVPMDKSAVEQEQTATTQTSQTQRDLAQAKYAHMAAESNEKTQAQPHAQEHQGPQQQGHEENTHDATRQQTHPTPSDQKLETRGVGPQQKLHLQGQLLQALAA